MLYCSIISDDNKSAFGGGSIEWSAGGVFGLLQERSATSGGRELVANGGCLGSLFSF